jgi:hypothetical protein
VNSPFKKNCIVVYNHYKTELGARKGLLRYTNIASQHAHGVACTVAIHGVREVTADDPMNHLSDLLNAVPFGKLVTGTYEDRVAQNRRNRRRKAFTVIKYGP